MNNPEKRFLFILAGIAALLIGGMFTFGAIASLKEGGDLKGFLIGISLVGLGVFLFVRGKKKV